MKLVKSTSYDPWYNLALEEHLFRNTGKGEITLYLWQNDHTVVIGRNQNAWRECRHIELENDGGKLARRLSGGGAVYHDLGNLNFTFAAPENLFDIPRQLQVIIAAVNSFGINAEFSGRNDIIAGHKKFSGNAYYYDRGNCYHHGTLLVSSDLAKLSRYLKVRKDKMKSKGVGSVESRVVNLSWINPDININNLSTSLIRSFKQVYNNKLDEIAAFDGDINEFENLYEKYSSWQWRYGKTPNFQVNYYNRFTWGDLDINLDLRQGVIRDAAVYSDAMDAHLASDLAEAIKEVRFTKEAISARLDILKESHDANIIEDIKLWFC